MRVEDLYRDIIMEHYKNPRNKGLSNKSIIMPSDMVI
jgi:NifU-like protein involved in Fe-S cluster formation